MLISCQSPSLKICLSYTILFLNISLLSLTFYFSSLQSIYNLCKIPVCHLGTVSSDNCITLVRLKFLLLHEPCLFVCLILLLFVVIFLYFLSYFTFTRSWKFCWVLRFKYAFSSLRLCARLWQTLKSLVNKIELFQSCSCKLC